MMKNTIVTILLLSVFLGASEEVYLGLFGMVVNVAKDDTLNVREKSDYRSNKTAALPLDALVGVDHCIQRGKSTWCKIFHIAQRDYDGFGYGAKPGWVNARYLKFGNRGYVTIDGKANCDYVLSCNNTACEVVGEYKTDPQTGDIVSLQTCKIGRKRLQGTNRFGAMPEDPDASGYCNTDSYVETYLMKQKVMNRLGTGEDPLQKKVLNVVSLLNEGDSGRLIAFTHPQKGIVMTWNVRFGGKEDLTFTREDIENDAEKRIHWGYTYGRGDEVHMSLYDYMSQLAKPFHTISKIEKLKNLKGFQCPEGSQCRGYEVFWIDETSKNPEFDWQGLVVIFEKYEGRWYVVGLLRDRWTV